MKNFSYIWFIICIIILLYLSFLLLLMYLHVIFISICEIMWFLLKNRAPWNYKYEHFVVLWNIDYYIWNINMCVCVCLISRLHHFSQIIICLFNKEKSTKAKAMKWTEKYIRYIKNTERYIKIRKNENHTIKNEGTVYLNIYFNE